MEKVKSKIKFIREVIKDEKRKKSEKGRDEKRKKGFIIIIDSALSIILLLLFMSIVIVGKIQIEDRYAGKVGMDIGSVVEKTKIFDANGIETPERVCVKIDLYLENYSESSLIYSSTKYGCTEIKNEYYNWRSFYNGSFYIIKITTWIV